MIWKPNTHVKAYNKSMHDGQTGIVVADQGQYIMVQADNPSYIHAHRISTEPEDSEKRFFWVDKLRLMEIK